MEFFIGQIAQFPYTFAPAGWAPCDGSLRPIAQHQALFSLLGTQFGGDGQSTFALPKLAPVQAANGEEVGYFIALDGIYPSRP
jgi:microcystin-dependent protein